MRFERSLLAALLGVTSAAVTPADDTDGHDVSLKIAKLPSLFKTKCAAIIDGLSVGRSSINFADFVPAGTNLSLPDNDPSCTLSSVLVPVDICRIALYISTSSTSSFTMEAWLPSNWSGRFLGTGNGGLNGCIGYSDMSYGTSLGFAAVGSNNGHNGTSGDDFYNNSGVVEDFVYRA